MNTNISNVKDENEVSINLHYSGLFRNRISLYVACITVEFQQEKKENLTYIGQPPTNVMPYCLKSALVLRSL